MGVFYIRELDWLRAQNVSIGTEISRLRGQDQTRGQVERATSIKRLLGLVESYDRHIDRLLVRLAKSKQSPP